MILIKNKINGAQTSEALVSRNSFRLIRLSGKETLAIAALSKALWS